MSYVDAFHDNDIIRVVERTEEGNREFQVYPAEYTFYVDDANGTHTTVYGNSVSKYTTKSKKKSVYHGLLSHPILIHTIIRL